uniref:RRM domain-containing protein n=1 Tax=Globodera pallida TaxID=36090 RepID=A0A183BRC9_GLOPA
AKDKKVAPAVQAKAQQPQKQNQLVTAVQKKKEKETLKFESGSDEDEELTDEEMEDESDEGEVLPQNKAKAQQQQKQREATTNGSAKKEGLSHQSAKYKAIVAEEDRRRAERDKVTIFLRCEALQKMTEHEIKSLHPDTLSVRTNNKGYCWLLFASEPTAEKALAALSKKTAISGKELYVDRCGAKAQSKSEKIKKGKAAPERSIIPTELVISNFPPATTTEQLQVIFPTAKSVRIVTLTAKKNNFRRATRAAIDFGNEADAKKAFDKAAQIKVGGAPVDVSYGRV